MHSLKFLSSYLCVGVVLGLLLARDKVIRLVGVDQVGRVVANDTGATGVYKSLDPSLGSHAQERLGAIDIDFVQDLVGHEELGAGRVDDDCRLDLDKQLAHGILVGQVAKVVLAAIDGLSSRTQVHG